MERFISENIITLSTNDYTITYADEVWEGGQLAVNLFFGQGFGSEVTVTFSVDSNSIFENGSSSQQLTYSIDELDSVDYTKSVVLIPFDDLQIDYGTVETINVAFASDDQRLNNLTENCLTHKQ